MSRGDPMEPAEPKEVGKCLMCDEPIYAGTWVRRVDEGMLHNDAQCLAAYIQEHYEPKELLDALQIFAEVSGEDQE